MKQSEKVFVDMGLAAPVIAIIIYFLARGTENITSLIDLIPYSVDSVALATVVSSAFFALAAILKNKTTSFVKIFGWIEIIISYIIIGLAYSGYYLGSDGEMVVLLMLLIGGINLLVIPISIVTLIATIVTKR